MLLFQHGSDTGSLIQKQNFKLDLFLFFHHEDCQTLEEVGQRVWLFSSLEAPKPNWMKPWASQFDLKAGPALDRGLD